MTDLDSILSTDLGSTPALIQKPVPNLFPTLDNKPYRIAIIGEAPGADEERTGQPFTGLSGRLLTQLMDRTGILRQSIFLGNVCQLRPPDNDIESFDWDGDEIQSGLLQLKADLEKFNPNLCVLLGASALRAAMGTKEAITYYRGTLFNSPAWGYKCLATYHPAACLRQYEWVPILKLDLQRAAKEGLSPVFKPPERALLTGLSHQDTLYKLKTLKGYPVSVDIEGGVGTLSCISFASSEKTSFIVPFTKTNNTSYWSEDEEIEIWGAVADVLADPSTPKILQNSLYDNFVLSYSYKCPIVNVADDTMLKHWEAYCELEKGLGFLCSIYTDEPAYKADRKADDLDTFWKYCCKDSAVTFEINTKLDTELTTPAMQEHYRFNMALLNPLLYMELRGIRYDYERAQLRRDGLLKEMITLQEQLNLIAGEPISIDSPKKFQHLLYEKLKLPKQTHRGTGKATANYEALLKLAKSTGHPATLVAIRLRSLTTRSRMLRIKPDPDKRVRCSYNAVGSKTGRLTCYTSPTGSGYNLQTIPEHDRDLFIPDEGYSLFQCDLSGADGWTVAAHCARLGDTTMLDDLQAGIKIAKVIAAMFIHGPEVSRLPRAELLTLTSKIPKNDPIYFGSKCCQHGTNYGMGKVLLSNTIFLQSEGGVNISAADAERLQRLYLIRYPGVARWHGECAKELKTKGYSISASGHKRVYFGRRDSHDTLKEWLANEAQENTTYATNKAAVRQWRDPENRFEHWWGAEPTTELLWELVSLSTVRKSGQLIIEPLHQVHDALVGQFPTVLTPWAIAKIKSYFNNPMIVANQKLTIPYDGAYGTAWSMDSTHKKGTL